MNYKHSFWFLWIEMFIGFIVGFFSVLFGVIIVAVSIIQAIIFYRCPQCSQSLLDVTGMIPNRCRIVGNNYNGINT